MSPTAQQPWTIGRLLNWTREHFAAKGIDDARLSAELLLAEALGCKKIELYTRFEREPATEQVTRFRELVRQATAHTPISYLLGRKEFFAMELVVTRDVLIPRPETETLVERALGFCKSLNGDVVHVFDMGTGSGCVALAVAKYEPRARVVATDISDPALAVAARNVERFGLCERVRTIRADGPALPGNAVPAGGFDLIVSNPPYIADEAVGGLPVNIREHEPRVALSAGDGLAFYRRLAAEGPAIVRTGGRCYVEIGLGQAPDVIELFVAAGHWGHMGTWTDLAGLDRVLGFERRE